MPALSAQHETQLRAAIAAHGLRAVEDLIVENATECATLTTTVRDDYSRPGSSRYGGRPDFPRDREWPRNVRDRRLSFVMQINLGDVPPFEGKMLPEQGMLYIFNDEWEVTVRYYPTENAENLLPAVSLSAEEDVEDQFSNPDIADLVPYRLSIQAAVDLPEWTSDAESAIVDALEATAEDSRELEDRYHALAKELHGKTRQWAGKLQGQPCWIGYVPEWKEWSDRPTEAPSPENGWMLLLLLDTNNDIGMMFGDAGYEMAFIQRDALTQQNFDNTYTQLESS